MVSNRATLIGVSLHASGDVSGRRRASFPGWNDRISAEYTVGGGVLVVRTWTWVERWSQRFCSPQHGRTKKLAPWILPPTERS